MVVEVRETKNGHGCDMSSSMASKIEAADDDELFIGSSNGDGSDFGEETSADGARMCTRRKRRKMGDSDEVELGKLTHKIKATDNSASDQDAVPRLLSDASLNGPGQSSLRYCRKLVLQQMHQSLKGGEGGIQECIRNALVSHSESGRTSAIRESIDCVEGSFNNWNSMKEHVGVTSSGLMNDSENSTSTELCRRAFFDILISEKFSALCCLLIQNFGDVNVERLLDVNVINSRLKDGTYETFPALYLTDIKQVWTKFQKVGNEMVVLAKCLSDQSRAHYEQFLRKPQRTEACGVSGAFNCRGCGEKADTRKCLVCESCEERYHVSCTDLSATEIPPKSWYCANCISSGVRSPHHNCVACEKLKTVPVSLVDGIPPNEEETEESFGLEASVDHTTNGSQWLDVCFICKSVVKSGDDFRMCGHSLCVHKFYHLRCLTSKQSGTYGPRWYCPSCLCGGCLKDQDDDKIVLCDGCDQAYHIYCMSPPRSSIPYGSWFCVKCNRELEQTRKASKAYEEMKSGGLEMLVTAAKTLSRQENMDAVRMMR